MNMSSAYYPAGAEFSYFAPWNYHKPMCKCEACDGTGHTYYAYDFLNDKDVECTEREYGLLPDDEATAEYMHKNLIKGIVETCMACQGTGTSPYELESEFDDDYI
ncbi:MAG: hypothetical protein SPF56_08480 [Bacteroidaceae bacterium]|nr:hypothetical protein [Bacteroidaceae bacterium]